MASPVYLASMVVMAVLALVVVAFTATGRDWKHYTPAISPPEGDTLSRLANSTLAWVLAFFVIVGLGIGATLVALGGGSTTFLVGVVGLLVLGFLVLGIYAAGRSRGHPHSTAVGEAILTLSVLFLVVLTAYLLTSFGA
jgi:archaellum biogenesis protein FlaJ (TadC family)